MRLLVLVCDTALPLRIVDCNTALTAFDTHNEVDHCQNQHEDYQRCRDAQLPGIYQFQCSGDRPRQTGHNAGKYNQRNTVTHPALGNLLTQPHQENCASGQCDHRGKNEPEPGRQHDGTLALQRKCYSASLHTGQ